MALNSLLLTQFLAVYRHRSLGKASRELGVSQPALSKAIRRLEDELRVPLFVRNSKGVEPTEFAETLSRRAIVVRNELDRASLEVEELRTSITGEIRIGVGPALAASLVSEVLGKFLSSRPQMRVRLIEGLFEALAEDLLSGVLDLAITTQPNAPIAGELSFESLFTDSFLIAVSARHPLTKQRKILPRQLLEFPWVLPPRGGLLWQRVLDIFERNNLHPPQPQIETNSSGCIAAMLRSGPYVSLVPVHLISREVERGEIAVLSVANMKIERRVIVLQRAESTLLPAAQAFLSELQARLADD